MELVGSELLNKKQIRDISGFESPSFFLFYLIIIYFSLIIIYSFI